MRTRSIAKQYKVAESFVYRGPEGNWKPNKCVTIGPGEETPNLGSDEVKRLLKEGKLVELDTHGQAIPNKHLTEMNGEEINRVFEGKQEPAIIRIIETTNFGKDTLSRILIFCEKSRYKKAALIIDQLLEK